MPRIAPAQPETQSATELLAARFLNVFTCFVELTKIDNPDEVVAQLSVKQLQALDLIRREPGISQKTLAQRLDVTSATVSYWIARMLESHLVERRAHETDARRMRLYLGTYGLELTRQLERAQIAAAADLLSSLPLREQQSVVETLERALAQTQQRRAGAPLAAHDTGVA